MEPGRSRLKAISSICRRLQLAVLARPNAGLFKLLHSRVREFGFWGVTADYKHENCILARRSRRDIFEAPDRARRKRNHIEGMKVDRFDLAPLVLPATAPCPGHRNEGLVSIVVVHHWAFARLGTAITEIKTFGDRNGCQARGREIPNLGSVSMTHSPAGRDPSAGSMTGGRGVLS